MDFQSLSRRDLQALCKSNGIRANMSNAAMAEALRCLPSVDRTDEIGSTAPPPPPPPMSAVKEVTIMEEEEQTHGSLLPRGSRARAKTRTVAAGSTDGDVPDQAGTLTSLGCQRTAARKAVVVPREAEEAVREEQEHGCPLPRGGRARRKTRKAAAGKTEEEEEVVPASHTLPGNKRTVAEEEAAAAPVAVDAEEVAVGRRTRRSARSKVKIALDQKEEDVQAAARKEQKDQKSCDDSEEHVVVVVDVVEEEATKPQEGQNVMRRAAPSKTQEDLQQDQRTVEDVTMAKKRTRRSTRSKVAAAARKGQKADSSGTTIGPEVDPKDDEVVPKVEEATKPQEGKNVTRRATVYKAQEEVQTGQVTVAPEATAAVEAEEVATKLQEGQNVMRRAAPCKTREDLQQDQRTVEEVATMNKRTRRSTRSKVAAASQKEQKADSSGTTIGPEVDPKDDEVVPKVEVEEATKPQEGKNVTRRATVCKAQEEVKTGQVTVAPEAMAEEVATAKRKRRRSARSKVRVETRKGQKADNSDAVNEPTVSDDPKKEQVVEVVEEERPTKPNEEERQQISNVRPFASLPKLEDSPILGVVSKPNAEDVSDKAAVADQEAIKEDGFSFTGEADLSNLLVNTLDRFAKPMYESTDKEEKKGGECWWMLL